MNLKNVLGEKEAETRDTNYKLNLLNKNVPEKRSYYSSLPIVYV